MRASDIERARSALAVLAPGDRDLWVKMAFALKSEFGDDAKSIWEDWGAGHVRPAQEVNATWKSAKPGPVTINSLFGLARQAGWKDDPGYKPPSSAEIEARRDRQRFQAEEDARVEAEMHAIARDSARRMWAAARPADDSHPYLVKKKVRAHGLRIGTWDVVDGKTGEVISVDNVLLVPMWDRERRLWSLQGIEASGFKRYLRGGAKSGHFHVLGGPPKPGPDGRQVVILAEGYATAASVHAATGHMVVVTFDTSNMATVCGQIRKALPDAVLVVAADNDAHLVADGKPNAGMEAARACARDYAAVVAQPGPGDWNDAAVKGVDVKAAIEAVLPGVVEEVPAAVDLVEPEIDGEGMAVRAKVTVLGHDGSTYYLYNHNKRRVVSYKRSEFGAMTTLIEICPDMQFWEMHFMTDKKKGVDMIQAFSWISGLADRRGVYNPYTIRGRGAWHDNGRLVFHHGEYLTVDGQAMHLADIQSEYIYQGQRPLSGIARDPLTSKEGSRLIQIARMARWVDPVSAYYLMGWTLLAPVCGALTWRPHCWVTGGAGSGKSTIIGSFVRPLIRGIGEIFQGASSEPGIRNWLKSDAIPVIIDETESNDEEDRKRLRQLLTMIRQSSTETEAVTAKGMSGGGGVQAYHIRSMFLLSSINIMSGDRESDASRMAVLHLKPACTDIEDDRWEDLKEALHRIALRTDLPGKLLARSISMLPVITKSINVFSNVCKDLMGGRQRDGDQYGTLLAGAWCLEHDAAPTQDDAECYAYDAGLRKVTGFSIAEVSQSDAQQVLSWLLESKIRVGADDVSIGEMVAEIAMRPISSAQIGVDKCIDILRRIGVTVRDKKMLVAPRSKEIQQIAAKSPFGADLKGHLSRLPGAGNFDGKTVRFTGGVTRVVSLPLSLVLGDDGPAL